MEQVDEAQADSDFVTAKALLTRLRTKMQEAAAQVVQEARGKGVTNVKEPPEDPYVIQRLALVTYRSETPSPEAALEDARDLLAILDPETTNDSETLAMWGAVHRRLWECTGDPEPLDVAIRSCSRGFMLRSDAYMESMRHSS